MGVLCSRPKYITITNQYHQPIKYKIEVQKPFNIMKQKHVGGRVAVHQLQIEASFGIIEQNEWSKVIPKFTFIKPGHSLPVKANIKGEVFMSVFTEDKEVQILTLQIESDTSWVITRHGELKQLEKMVGKNKKNGRTNDEHKISEEVKDEYKTTAEGQTPILKNSKGQNNDNKNEEQENASEEYKDTEDKSKNTNSLGEQQTKRQNLLEIVPKKSGSIFVKNKSLKWYNKIRGIDVTNNDTVLLIFYNNQEVKSIRADSEVLSVLSLPARPCDISVLNATTGVVAADANRFYVIKITNDSHLSLSKEVKLSYTISAVTSYNGNFVALCETCPETTKLISMHGKEIWSVRGDEIGAELFLNPVGITTTTINKNVVIAITYYHDNRVILLEAKTGKFITTIVVERKPPINITVDNNGNAYVCHWDTNEIISRLVESLQKE